MNNSNDFVIEDGVLTEYRGKDAHIVIPDGVTEIGESVFANKYEILLEDYAYNGKGLDKPEKETLKYYKNIKDINIQSVEFPDGLKKIGANAFSFNESLKCLDIPDSVEVIEDFAFCSCSCLVEVILPEHLLNGEGVSETAFKNSPFESEKKL